MSEIKAPFTAEQIDGLNKWQLAGYVHEFTCAKSHKPYSSRVLEARTEGWFCRGCNAIVQDWAHDFMAEGPRANPLEVLGWKSPTAA